jgi:uncharacterized protein YkwD
MTLSDLLNSVFSSNRRVRRNPVRGFASIDALEARLLLTAPSMTDSEQYMVELINRARANPSAEATRYGIGLNDGVSQQKTISTAAKQPLAPQQDLINVAGTHSQDMIDRDYFAHETLGSGTTFDQRVTAAGYNWNLVAENIGYAAKQVSVSQTTFIDEVHAGLIRSSGHRENIMLPGVEEVGVGARLGSFKPPNNANTFNFTEMVTEDFGSRNQNPFITGVVYTDSDNNDFYTIGEAIRSGTVTATNASTGAVFSDAIGFSGGYGFVVPAGTYLVTARITVNGAVRVYQRSGSLVVGTDNVKVDFETNSGTSTPVGLVLASTTTTLNENGNTTSAVITVSRNDDAEASLLVNLASDSTTNLTFPASVTIPAGQTSTTFIVNAVDDGIIDGNQTVRITATAFALQSATRSLTIIDRTYPAFPAGTQTQATSLPAFAWSSISNAATYQVFVNNVTTNQAQVINVSGVTNTSYTATTELPIGTYNVWVRGFTASGQAGVWSLPSVWNLRPTTTVLNSGRTETSDSFSIGWNPILGAATYDVWVDRLTSSTSAYFRNTSVAGTSVVVSGFDVGQYGVWVRARNSAGDLVTWSPRATINVNYATAEVAVTGNTLSSTPTLTWLPVNGAAQYQVWVNNLSTGASAVINSSSVQTTSLAMNTLPAGSYRAWVRGRDLDGGAYYTWSTAFDFEIGRPPRIQGLANSVQSAQPSITWTAVAGAVRYEIWIGNLTTGQREISVTNLQTTAYTPTQNLASGTGYRVWIRAFDSSDNVSAWSAAASFTVASNSTDPSELLPELLRLEELALEQIFASAEEWMHDAVVIAEESTSAEDDIAYMPQADADPSEIAESFAALVTFRSPARGMASLVQLDFVGVPATDDRQVLN